MRRGGLRGLWLLFLGLLWATGARAEQAEQVELRETRGLRPGLCAALRIQLADTSEVRCLRDIASSILPERIARAASRVRDGRARLCVLLERDPDPALVRMYVVGGQEDQAVLAFERIEDRADPDVDRSLALKVRAALGAVHVMQEHQATSPAAVEAPLAASLAQPAATSLPPGEEDGVEAPAKRARVSGALEAGGGIMLGAHLRGLGQVGLLGRLTRDALSLEAGPSARWVTALHASGLQGSVDENEWAIGLTLRALYRARTRVELGAALEPTWGFLRARGITPEGDRGEARLGRFAFTVALDARLRLFSAVFLRTAPGVEVSPVRQRFAIDDTVTVELARARFVVPISLWVGWP